MRGGTLRTRVRVKGLEKGQWFFLSKTDQKDYANDNPGVDLKPPGVQV